MMRPNAASSGDPNSTRLDKIKNFSLVLQAGNVMNIRHRDAGIKVSGCREYAANRHMNLDSSLARSGTQPTTSSPMPFCGKYPGGRNMPSLTTVALGLMVLLIVTATGCDDAAPTTAVQPTVANESVTATAAPTGGDVVTELPDGVTWVLNSLDGQPLFQETFIKLELDGDRLWGWDGCNSFASQPEDGPVVAGADGSFSTPEEIVSTLRGCREPEDILENQADAYMSALLDAGRFRVVGNRLEIFDAKGAARLVFVEQQPLPGYPVELVGTGWRLLPEGDAEDARSATLSFLNARLAAGATACRDYVATYWSLDVVSSARIGSRQSCSEETRELEAAFISTLSSADEYSVVEDEGTRRLSIRTSLGKMLFFEPLPPVAGDIANTEWSLKALVRLSFVYQREDGPDVWEIRHATEDVEGVLPPKSTT